LSTEPHGSQDNEATTARQSDWHERKWAGTWWAPILVAVGIFVWCVLIYSLIGHRVREWQYGTVPYIPGESPTSSKQVGTQIGGVPNQVQLPQTQPSGGAR
jgi:hypothetical protein